MKKSLRRRKMSRQTVKIGEYKGFEYYVVKIIDVEGGVYDEWGGNNV